MSVQTLETVEAVPVAPEAAPSQLQNGDPALANAILAQLDERRKQKALAIAELAGVRLIVHDELVFQVQSQSHNTAYVVRLHRDGQPHSCDCYDDARPCKHIGAAAVYVLAMGKVEELCRKHGINEKQLSDNLTAQICSGVPSHMAQRLTILMHVSHFMFRPRPQHVHLVVDSENQIVAIYEDGRPHPPKTKTALADAIRWLVGHDFSETNVAAANDGRMIYGYCRNVHD